MSHHSEERVSDSTSSTTAHIVPFQRPQSESQSELQKAVQERARESMARERDRAKLRPAPWRRLLVLVLAAVPVVLTFGAALAFIGALRQFNSAILNSTPSQPPAQTTQTTVVPPTSTPEVVMLQPFATPATPPKNAETRVSPPAR